jgi:hypothetical protein
MGRRDGQAHDFCNSGGVPAQGNQDRPLQVIEAEGPDEVFQLAYTK